MVGISLPSTAAAHNGTAANMDNTEAMTMM
jgi:hypothetical protein